MILPLTRRTRRISVRRRPADAMTKVVAPATALQRGGGGISPASGPCVGNTIRTGLRRDEVGFARQAGGTRDIGTRHIIDRKDHPCCVSEKNFSIFPGLC